MRAGEQLYTDLSQQGMYTGSSQKGMEMKTLQLYDKSYEPISET